jgi:hypothetical protein
MIIIAAISAAIASETPAAPAPAPAAKKFDCLAGLCLNAKSGELPPTVVTVSAQKWTRQVEVCSGRIVSIAIQAGWYNPGFRWSDLLPGTSTNVGESGDGTLGIQAYERVLVAMVDKGWFLVPNEKPNPLTILGNPEVIGARGVTFDRHRESEPNGWMLTVASLHPDHKDLCRAKNEQGL